MRVILGSSSPWRKQVLSQIVGSDFSVLSPNIDEKEIRDPDPAALTIKLAHAKAKALLSKISGEALLITSDQVVVCNGMIREKPETVAECREFLRSYQYYPAQVVCGIL